MRQTQVRVPPDAYPHWQGQTWADPDVAHAAALLGPVLADPARGRERALRGQSAVLRSHGHRAVGLRILDRLEAIAAAGAKRPAPRRRRASAPA